MPSEFMTLREAAKFLNLSEKAVRLFAEKGTAEKDKDGKMLIRMAEIIEWANRGVKDLDAFQLEKLEKDYNERPTLIYPLLDSSCIRRSLFGKSKTAVITELVNLLIDSGNINEKHRQKILKAVMERERTCSTAIIEGLAIPHPREPLKGIIKKPRIAIGLSWSGIDFESIDGKPTHVVILLCVPKLDIHLQLLARLSKLFSKPQIRVALCRAKSEEEVVETFASFEKKIK